MLCYRFEQTRVSQRVCQRLDDHTQQYIQKNNRIYLDEAYSILNGWKCISEGMLAASWLTSSSLGREARKG